MRLSVVVAGMIAALILIGCREPGESQIDSPAANSDGMVWVDVSRPGCVDCSVRVPSTHPLALAAEPYESLAARQSAEMRAGLDVTTFEEFARQIPDIQPEAHRTGSTRTFTWTFDDGSQIVAGFQPRGGNLSGLVLYVVDVID